MKNNEFGHTEGWYIRHSKSIITNFLGALDDIGYLSLATADFDKQQLEAIANKCGLVARDLKIIFKHVEDLEEDLF